MYQFVAGFVVALLAVVAVIVLFLRKKVCKIQRGKNEHFKQLAATTAKKRQKY